MLKISLHVYPTNDNGKQTPTNVFVSSVVLKNSCPEVIKLFCMLNSTEHESFPAHKCWHFNIYERENSHSRLIGV